MAIVTNCPDCGKRARLPDADAGQEAICAACGSRFVVARPQPAPTPATNLLHPVAQAAARRQLGPFVLIVIALAGAVFAVMFGVHLYSSMRRSAIANDQAVAFRMNAEAQGLVRSHQLSEASAKYHDLLEFISSREGNDPVLMGLADNVRRDEDAVEHQLALQSTSARAIAAATQTPIRPAPVNTVEQVKPLPATQIVEHGPATGPTELSQVATSATAPSVNVAIKTSERPSSKWPSQNPAPSRPPVQAVADNAAPPTDQQIGEAIQRGVNYLIAQFDPKTFELRGGIEGRGRRQVGDAFHDGADVLCVYALMQCGEAINDPRLNMHNPFMTGCIEAMNRFALDDRFGTYSRGLRATALALNNRKEDRQVLAGDVAALLKTNIRGAYTYYSSFKNDARENNWDNSNSQYGLLGVWSGAEAEIEVPSSYWTAVEKHWTSTQLKNGEWGYHENDNDPRLTMTCAGIASLFVCHDWLDAPKFGKEVGREPFSPPLKKGLDWLEQGNNAVDLNAGHWGYALYGVERVGLASGFKFFGTHNWYPELALTALDRQGPGGAWGEEVNTAYALLFLSRGRHPVIMNKLRYEGYWANRPRDIANLANYASHELERPINWQVVPLAADWTDWVDSPILYLASHVPPKLSDADVRKIQQYVMAGGMLFVQADGDAPAMTAFAVELSHRLFPQYEMTDVPPGHPLFNSVYKLPLHPPLRMVSNGARILMLYSPTDISHHWQLREQRGQAGKPIFQLGINMFVYAAGRRDLRNRLDTNNIAEVPGIPSKTVKIARVQYAGAWDPEPFAWTRFSNWFRRQTNYALDVQTVSMRELDPAVYPFAHLTGTARYNATPGEVAAVKSYVERGGVLLIDLTGGTGGFDESVRGSLLGPAFPTLNPTMLSASHPLLQPGGSGMEDLSRPRLRPFAIERLGAAGGAVEIYQAGKGHVLFTSLDITSGLLNTGTWGIVGYEPAYAQSFIKNAIFWTLDGQKDR